MSGTAADVRRDGRITVVVATRNRRRKLLRTLDRLASLPEKPPVVVVNNASTDGAATAVALRQPDVRLVRLSHNHGACARNIGVRRAGSPYVAFADDDSCWAQGPSVRQPAPSTATADWVCWSARSGSVQ